MRVLSNDMHDSHFLVHEVEVFVAGISADDLDSHCLGRLLVPAEHHIGIGTTALARHSVSNPRGSIYGTRTQLAQGCTRPVARPSEVW